MRFDPQKFDEDVQQLTDMYVKAIKKKRLHLDLPKQDDVRAWSERRKPYFAGLPPPVDLLLRLERTAGDADPYGRLQRQSLYSIHIVGSLTARLEAHLLTRAIMADTLATEDDLCRALEMVRGFSELTEPLAAAILHHRPSNKALRTVISFAPPRRQQAMLRLLVQDPEARDLVPIIQAAKGHSSSEADSRCLLHGGEDCACRWNGFSDAARQIVKRASQMLVTRAVGNDELLQVLRACLGGNPVVAEAFLAREPNEEILGEFLLFTFHHSAAITARAAEMVLEKSVISNTTLLFLLHAVVKGGRVREGEILRPWAEKAAKRLFLQRPSGDDLAHIAESETAYAEPAKARFKANWLRYFLHASGVGSCHSPFSTRLTGLDGREAGERLEQDAERFGRLWNGEQDS